MLRVATGWPFLRKETIAKKINLIGLSLGSAYAIHFYRAFPEKIDSLTFVDCALPEHASASQTYLKRVLYDWLNILKRQRVESFLSIPQIKASVGYATKRLTKADIIEHQSKHRDVIEHIKSWMGGWFTLFSLEECPSALLAFSWLQSPGNST